MGSLCADCTAAALQCRPRYARGGLWLMSRARAVAIITAITALAAVITGTPAIARAPQQQGMAGTIGTAAHPPPILSMSVCSPTGAGVPGSCSSGFDTDQDVLAPIGVACANPLPGERCSINTYAGLSTLADEH